MRQGNKSLYGGLIGLTGVLVLGYLAYDYFSRTTRPCEAIFEQTSTQLGLKLSHLDTEGSIVLGRTQVQDLTENAQLTALNLQTCCIVLNVGDVNPDQFLECQNAGRQYENKIDNVIAQVERLRLAQETGASEVIESLRREIAVTVNEAKTVAENLHREVLQLDAPPLTPARTNDTNSAEVAPLEVEGQPRTETTLPTAEARVINYDTVGDPRAAIKLSSGPLTSIVVQPLTRFDEPSVKEILIAAAGTSLQSVFYPVQRSTQLGRAMVVEPGRYDVVIDFEDQSMVHLVQGLDVGEAQQATIATDSLISFIVPSDLTLEEFPLLSEVFLMDAGSELASVFYKKQSSKLTGVPLVVPAGAYDVYVEPKGGRFIKLIDNVSLAQGQGVRVDINSNAAAIVYADPKLETFELAGISIVAAGTDITKSYYPIQQATDYGEPMMVPANGSYDVVLHPVDGRPVKVQRNVSPDAGRLTLFSPQT